MTDTQTEQKALEDKVAEPTFKTPPKVRVASGAAPDTPVRGAELTARARMEQLFDPGKRSRLLISQEGMPRSINRMDLRVTRNDRCHPKRDRHDDDAHAQQNGSFPEPIRQNAEWKGGQTEAREREKR